MKSGALSAQQPERGAVTLFLFFAAITIASACAAFVLGEPALAAVPLAFAVAYVAISDIRRIYLLLFFTVPLSVELFFENGVSTNVPAEPLMIGVTLIFIFYIIQHPHALSFRFLTHPLIVLLFIHVFWIAFTTFFSEDPIPSLKFLAAKLWYVIAFVFMAALLVQNRKQFVPLFWYVFIPMLVLTVITILRHATYQFRFDNVNDTVVPYFRNHVTYAAILSVFLPFVWFARYWQRKGSLKSALLKWGILILVIGIAFSFTRGAWLAVLLAIVSYYAIRWRLFKTLIGAGVGVVVIGLSTLLHNNRYLNFSPEFEKTIYHETFSAHMAATAAGLQDVSSAERIYRWLAAKNMFIDRPEFGYGPGNFYPYYKQYTVAEFQTYISDNEERSTVHNYFLLMLVEQGFVGFAIFLAITILVLFYGQAVYHRTRKRSDKQFVMAIVLSMVILMVQNMLSDLVETDKVGSFFFLNLALLVIMDLRSKNKTYTPAG